MAETGISHHLPQLMRGDGDAVLAFLTLLWIDWRMATAMFVALPLAIGILLASTRIQQKLSSRQIAAKIEAGNRLEEYLQGIRVMKAYNMVGGRFVRLREAFAQLRRGLHPAGGTAGAFRSAVDHRRTGGADADGAVRDIPAAGRHANRC